MTQRSAAAARPVARPATGATAASALPPPHLIIIITAAKPPSDHARSVAATAAAAAKIAMMTMYQPAPKLTSALAQPAHQPMTKPRETFISDGKNTDDSLFFCQ